MYSTNSCFKALVRLVGGSGEHEGRVEILCDGVWGTACDYGWGTEEANAVCRQLGYSSAASVHPNAHFGQGSGPIWLDEGVYCPTSDKKSLLECFRGPWGCSDGASCGHDDDVGVRCAGERDESAADAIFANADLNEGLSYGVDRYTYYDMTSRLTFTPTTANNGDTLQCHVYGVVRSASLEVTGGVDVPRSITPCNTPSPSTPPRENILFVNAVEIKGEDNLVNLVISCHVNFTDQPSPYLHTYTIGTETTTLSSSSCASAILSPRPNACIELTCSATNGIGTTSATLTHCPQDRPAEDIISVEFETQEDDDDEPSLNITCHVDQENQPFPPINTFLVAVDDSIISDSASPMVTIDPRPNECINVVCTGMNEYGETEATKTYCPTQSEPGPEQPGSNILRIQTTEIRGEGNLVTLIITCHVDLSDQPYPHLHTYTITADNDTLSSSSCASAILSPLPNACINVTCSATNGIGDTLSWMEHCRTESPSGGTSVTLEGPSPLTPNLEVTANCTADAVFGSEHVIWYLNGVQITDGVQTTSTVDSLIHCLEVRLVGGSDEHEGRVEILCDGVWGTACDWGWDTEEGNAVCRQLGYSSAASVYHDAHFGEGSGPIWLDHGIKCPTLDKNSLLECYHYPWGCHPADWDESCGHGDDVGVRCAGERDEGAAAAIFTNADLNKGLSAGVDRFTYYDISSELTFTPTITNNGDILQCQVYGVVRSVTLKVTGGGVPQSIAPCITPSPGTPPGENILSIDAVEIKGEDNLVNLVISCHVNFTDQPSPYLHTYSIGTENTTLSSSSCASAILSPRPNACIELTCSATNGIGTTSATLTHCPNVRLVGGSGEHEGRVEILCDGVWGTACDNGWGTEEGNAVCRQLGYSSAASVHHNAHFGQGSGPIWLDNGVYCPTADKNSLLECFRRPWGCYVSRYSGRSCGHSSDVGVVCAGKRNESAAAAIFANADLKEGLTYGVDSFTYYDMTSELTFTPTTANNGDILQCQVYGVVRSVTLEVTGDVPRSVTPCITPSPGTPPGENILSIDAVEIKGEGNVFNLVISCHVNFTDQPTPYLHTYTIGTENTTLSSSSCASAILSPSPNACIELACSATNGIGTTSATRTHCPQGDPIMPIAGPRQGALQKSSTTYVLLVVIFILSVITYVTVLMKRKNVF
ncbi:scavenger receptor cysteine-rich domain-containing protein DMBT1-like [Diadema antillarum]|uniref:scavenger receptor cysteine-rich domain-containing protein DMBT1-like n=1 Tax=Diadema antillarum TaxID=105358 RepID=UPI003A8BDE5E